MPEAIIYCRASKDRTGAGLSVAGQEQDCREFARKHGLDVREVFADNDITAAGHKRRPAYEAMLAYLAAHSGTTVIIWHTDRLHRHLAELETYIDLAETHGVLTRAVRAGDLDLATPSGRMVARMLGVVARHELEHMSERRKAGKARAAAAGRWKGGRRPFGYQRDGVTIAPPEAALIRQGSEDILAGVSLAAVSRSWNATGITTTEGHQWAPREVSRVLRRARNAGLMEHSGQVIGKAEWPPIVSEDTWRGVCAVLTDPNRRTTPGPARQWLLSGIAECGVCADGATVIASRVTGQGRAPRPVYRCRGRRDGRSHVARDVAQLDNYVTQLALARLAHRDLAHATQPAGEANRSAGLHAQMTLARQRLDQAAEMFAAGTINASQLAIITGKLNADLDTLGRQVADLARKDALAEFHGQDPAVVWDGLDLERRRAVITSLMRVIVDPAPRGRIAGWRPGEPYFHEASIRVQWRR